MRLSQYGFTILELVIALLIGSILTSIALSQFGNVRGRYATAGARNTFQALHARARAQAIELGGDVRMLIDVSGDSVVLVDADGNTLENLQFGGELNVDLQSSSNIRLCMNSRGYADVDCNNFNSAVNLEFWHNADSTTVKILPLGQLVY
jgi:prepilin-type N-terminal cleavage/methylation domain-containing protein